MPTIGSRLRKLREMRGYSLDGLAAVSGITRDHIGRIERGESKNPRFETIEALSKALEVHPAEITIGSNNNFPIDPNAGNRLQSSNNSNFKTDSKSAGLGPEFSSEFFYIPLLIGTVEAGDFNQDFSHWQGETLLIPAALHKEDLIAWKIKGRSMEPHYLDGDTVIINKKYDCIDGIDVVARKNGAEVTVKQLKMFPDGIVELRPYNTDYSTVQFKSTDEVEIVGEVVSLHRDIKKKKR
jgi:SOS-response transcriptional repressor LexA